MSYGIGREERGGPGEKAEDPWSWIYIGATIVAVLLFGLFNQEFGNVFETISNLTPGFLTIAIVVMLVYLLFEGELIRLLMRSQKIPMKFWTGQKIGLLGIYYSYITPSSTGASPCRPPTCCGIRSPPGCPPRCCSSSFFCFQCAFVLCSAVSFVYMLPKLQAENPGIIP